MWHNRASSCVAPVTGGRFNGTMLANRQSDHQAATSFTESGQRLRRSIADAFPRVEMRARPYLEPDASNGSHGSSVTPCSVDFVSPE